VNFTTCLASFRSNSTGPTGGTDYNGKAVKNTEAVGLEYETCKSYCGPGQEPFDWSLFSQQFSAWLLPWLALVSQLPFGSETRLDNSISGKFFRGIPHLS
jgi:hypothetical protein